MKFARENNIFGVCLNCCVYCADERHQSHELILYLVISKVLWSQLRLASIPFPATIFKGGAVLGSLKACIPAGAEYRTHIFTQGDYFPTTKANPYLALLLTNTKISNSSHKKLKKKSWQIIFHREVITHFQFLKNFLLDSY